MHLLSFLALSSFVFTGLAIDTENKKICMPTDEGWCTVTVVRNGHFPMPGVTDTVDTTRGYVLDNECNSILDSTDCDSENEVGNLCRKVISEDATSAELPVTEDSGLASNFYVEAAGSEKDDGLQGWPPIFTATYGDGEPVSDEKSSSDSCTCAHSSTALDIAQVCSCWIKCTD